MNHFRRLINKINPISAHFIILMGMTIILFLLLGVYAIFQHAFPRTPSSTMKGFAPSVSSQLFMDMLAMETTHLKGDKTLSSFSAENVSNFILEWLTQVNLSDPKTLMAGMMPSLADSRVVLLYGSKTYDKDYPIEYIPPAEIFQTDPPPDNKEEDSPITVPSEPSDVKPRDSKAIEKAIFIYHSHNRESWLPELEEIDEPDLAYDTTKNVTLLGKRMQQNLEKAGIGTIHSDKDYPSSVADFTYPNSYEYSHETVHEAFAANDDLEFLFDIHRDSQKRSITTISIQDKDYAQLYFVVGQKNPNWEKNMAFAQNIHNKLNQLYPGISKGIFNKNSNGNSEYNQSLSPNSSLIEIGGVENTIDEAYRTVDILSKVIAEIYLEAEQVNVPVIVKPSN